MSIKFKYFYHRLNFLALALLFFTLLFLQTKTSLGKEKFTEINSYKPRYRYHSWYVISLNNIPIGTAIASSGNKKTNIPNETVVNIRSRMGSSPITSKFFVHMEKQQGNFEGNEPFLIKEKLVSVADPSQTEAVSNDPNNVIFEEKNSFSTPLMNWFFETDDNTSVKNTLSPFPKDFFNFQDEFEADYAGNHLLKYGKLKLNNDLALEIKEISKSEYQRVYKKLAYARLDVGLIASFEDEMDDIDRLVKTLSLCQAEMTYLNKTILKKMPHESYLMYRRIINLHKFCRTLEQEIKQNDPDDIVISANKTQYNVLNLFHEDPIELPHAVSEFSDRTLYYNQNMMFLWPRLTTLLVQNSVKELQNLFRLDFNRKSLLGIKLRIKSLAPRSVVRVDIKQINSPIDFKIHNTSKKPYFLEGSVFANNSDYNLSDICRKYSGNVGIDLKDDKMFIVSSVGIRGIWNSNTKLNAARVFALQALSEKQCNTIHFNANPDLVSYLTHELENLKKEVLSQENAMLLSNYRQKKLWVIPGRYRLIISSVKNEKILSIQEFTVAPKTQTNVIANVQ